MEPRSLPLDFDSICTHTIEAEWLSHNNIKLDVLRLDLLHPVISGNKWFKLKYYLEEALHLNKPTVATFGGAFSNHIVATAFACKSYGLQSVGIIRGEQPEVKSPTLQQAEQYGMQLIFVTREQYQDKERIADEFSRFDWYWIMEGGYGSTGARGAAEIMQFAAQKPYTHILASVGTGTMLSGLIVAAKGNQEVHGFSSMKGNTSLEDEIRHLLPQQKQSTSFTLHHDYHFGGYAKKTDELISFIKRVYEQHNLPLDFVYTGKLFFGIADLVRKSTFPQGAELLMIHSGGLQGNKSDLRIQL